MKKLYKQIAIVGRFTIVHLGHEALFLEAAKRLEIGGKLTILIGSAGHYPSPKHPLSYKLRAEMLHYINVPLLEEKKIRLEIKPLYDFLYTPSAWTMQVQRFMDPGCALLGHKKTDGSSDWVDEDFPDTDYIDVPDLTKLHATDIRKLIYDNNVCDATSVSPEVKVFVDHLIHFGSFRAATSEYLANTVSSAKFATHPYPDNINSLCADAVVECKGYLLLGQRKGVVGRGSWALPGGHKDKGETLKSTALRELDEETCIKVPPRVLRKSIVASKVFDSPGRSETTDEKVTEAFHIVLDNEASLPKIKDNPKEDLENVSWIRLCDVRSMSMSGQIFADHAEIIHHFTGALL